jgi:hypothetical protein
MPFVVVSMPDDHFEALQSDSLQGHAVVLREGRRNEDSIDRRLSPAAEVMIRMYALCIFLQVLLLAFFILVTFSGFSSRSLYWPDVHFQHSHHSITFLNQSRVTSLDASNSSQQQILLLHLYFQLHLYTPL